MLVPSCKEKHKTLGQITHLEIGSEVDVCVLWGMNVFSNPREVVLFSKKGEEKDPEKCAGAASDDRFIKQFWE